MGLDKTDLKPDNLSLIQAYEYIHQWYSRNLPLLKKDFGDRDWFPKSEALMRALPPVSQLSTLEVRAVLGEVIYGHLECGYNYSDGQYKMAAYAIGALETAGFSWSLNELEKQQLMKSKLWQYLFISR